MIQDNFITINVNSSNKKWFIEHGYISKNTIASGPNRVDMKYNITLKDALLITKMIKVNVKCDLCNKTYNIKYLSYQVNVNHNGVYSCKSCSSKHKWTSSDYRKDRITIKGEKHWSYGLKKELSPSWGMKRTSEQCKNISKALLAITEDGITKGKRGSIRAAITQKKYGLRKLATEKGLRTKDINKTWVTYKCAYHGKWYYRSSFELAFLKEREALGDIANFKNADYSIPYKGIDGKMHRYIPDYYDTYNQCFYEIKSDYTWGVNDKKLRVTNKLKLRAIRKMCLSIILIIFSDKMKDRKEIYNGQIFKIKDFLWE